MSQLRNFLKKKQKKNADFDIDNLNINNTSYEDIADNFDMSAEDAELGRAIYNKELSLGNIQRVQNQAQQGIQNQYSLKTKYHDYLRKQQGLDSSVAATVNDDLSLRSKLLSQMGAVNTNALNNTQQVNQNYDEIKSEIISRYEAERQANYDALMSDESGAGDNLQNIETYDTTYRYDTIGDVAISKNDYDLAKKWLDEQEKKGTLPTGKISELKQKLVEWESKLTDVPEEKARPVVEHIKTSTTPSGVTTENHFNIGGKRYKFTQADSIVANKVGITSADFEKDNEWKLVFKNGQTYLAKKHVLGITVYKVEE